MIGQHQEDRTQTSYGIPLPWVFVHVRGHERGQDIDRQTASSIAILKLVLKDKPVSLGTNDRLLHPLVCSRTYLLPLAASGPQDTAFVVYISNAESMS